MNKDHLINFFQSILPTPYPDAAELVDKFSPRQLVKNEILLPEGRVNGETCFLEAGYIRSFVHDTEGNEVTTAILPPATFATDFVSFFRRMPARETLQAVTPCTIWSLSYADVQHYFHGYPAFREFGRLLLISNYAKLQDRMLQMIQCTAEQRYKNLLEQQPEIFNQVPLKMIASCLGITDSSLSRIRKAYSRARSQKKGL